jgi:UDP-glucose 4-epimerase
VFKDKILLITGGTGSFGNAVLRRFVQSDLKEIRIFSRDEKKQDDMRNEWKNDKIKFFIGDVRDIGSIDFAMDKVDFVFHAAALKQVPSCEFYPMEAVKTNVIGTDNVVTSAIRHKIKRIICLSTDKAVYPINAMGMSKALLEKIAVSKSRLVSSPVINCTRYGNVMASRGSVIPLFIQQIKNSQPITITDPSMTRFMMSLDDAVDLVMYAFQNGKPGDTFVQKAPAATIHQLATVLIELFEKPTEIKIIGTRHGEKLHETLLTREEFTKAEDLGEYYRIAPDDRDLNYNLYFNTGDKRVSEQEDYNSFNTHRLSNEELRSLLMKLDYVQEELKINQ